MDDTVSTIATRQQTYADPSDRDLSRLPAYVEPPRPKSPRSDPASRSGALALTGTALGTLVLMGWYVYANGPDAPVAASTPPRPVPAPLSVLPRDVPLPSGLHYATTTVTIQPAATPVGRTGHPARLTRPSRG